MKDKKEHHTQQGSPHQSLSGSKQCPHASMCRVLSRHESYWARLEYSWQGFKNVNQVPRKISELEAALIDKWNNILKHIKDYSVSQCENDVQLSLQHAAIEGVTEYCLTNHWRNKFFIKLFYVCFLQLILNS